MKPFNYLYNIIKYLEKYTFLVGIVKPYKIIVKALLVICNSL